jgi:leader peptidase (prepilin peptidase)/N-methyltransferase
MGTAAGTVVGAVLLGAAPLRTVLLGVVLGGGAGVVAGAAARGLVGRLRRGAVVAPPGCVGVAGAAWAVVGGAAAAGALPGAWVPVLLALTWFGVAAGAVDLAHRRLPDALTLPALPAALLLVAPLGPAALGRAAGVAVLAAAAHAAVRLVAPGAMGGGDVKLAAPLGAVLGAVSWPAAVLAAAVAAAATAVLAAVLRRRSVPHGPSMLLATVLVAAAGAAGAG